MQVATAEGMKANGFDEQIELDVFCAGRLIDPPFARREFGLHESPEATWKCRTMYCCIMHRAGAEYVPDDANA